MSDMTWKDLRDLDCEALRTLGESWKSYTSSVSEQAQRLRDDVVKGHLSIENYESDTADMVREQVVMTADRFEDDLSDYALVRLSTGMFEAADALEAEQRELEELIPLIEDRGFAISGDPHGYEVGLSEWLRDAIDDLKPPQWLKDSTGLYGTMDSDAPVAANTQITELRITADTVADQYQDWLRAVMSRAHDADDDAAGMLATMREDPPELPPHFGETYDDLLEDYKEELSEEVAEEMQAIADGSSGLSPEQVNQWWEDLSDAERDALVAEHPEWVGPVDGIPVEARDTANRAVLESDIAALDDRIAEMEAELSGIEQTDSVEYLKLQEEIEGLREEQVELERLQDRITDDEGNPAVYEATGQEYYLLDFDTGGSGQMIVSIGNPDEAANVNAYVPGTGSSLADENGTLFDRIQAMSDDAQDMDPSRETATVLWLGYDAPDNVVPEATETEWAQEGAEGLESFTQGIRATAEGDPANLTLTGHSYGTTMIGVAAASEGVDADNIVFTASPGVGVDTVSALGVDEENVHATRNDRDVIQYGMVHGTDPTSEAFGAEVFHSDAVGVNPKDNHSTYWDDGNLAGRRSMAKVFTGQTGD